MCIRDRVGYQFSELLAGVVSVGESALRFTLALGLGITSAGASLFGADEYAENTMNAAEGWLSESWTQQMREGMQNTFNADAQDMRSGKYSFLFGQILPGVVIAASTGGAGAGTMLGAGTSSGYSAYAVFGEMCIRDSSHPGRPKHKWSRFVPALPDTSRNFAVIHS